MTIEQDYLKTAGENCPLCESPDITGEFVEIDGQSAHQPCYCNVCNAEWIDHYKIDEVSIINRGKDNGN